MDETINALKKVSKAVAGAVAGLIVLWLAKHNIIIADDLNDAIEILISGVITGAAVYLAPRNQGERL
jgi:hypothetical protein